MLISEFAEKIGVSRADVENWTSRLKLSTEYAPTTRGAARQYSRENVLELAILAAFVQTGLAPRKAARILAFFLEGMFSLERGKHKNWIAYTAGSADALMGADEATGLRLDVLTDHSSPHACCVIHLGKVVETVDTLFAEKASS